MLKGNNTRSEFDKTQTRSNIRHSEVTIHKTTATPCNQDVTTLKQEVTIVTQDVTTLKQEVPKNIQGMIIHKRIPTNRKKDNTNQNAELEKGRPKQGIGVNTRRLLTMYLKVLSLLSV